MDGVNVSGRGHASKSYQLSGKIMLSSIVILFAVILFIICLHIYARWFLLRSRRNQYRRRWRRTHLGFSDQQTSAASLPSRGLEATVLRSLPVFVLCAKPNDDELLECAVCLSPFQENEIGRRLPKCNHSFHIECIDMWFHSHSTCPLCRAAVNPDPPAHVIDVPVQVTENPENASKIPVRDGAGESDTELCSSCRHGEETGFSSSSSSSSSKKTPSGFIEVPRTNENFRVLEEELGFGSAAAALSPSGQGLKSPGGRMLSLKKMLSRERKGSDSRCGSVTTETDIESGEGQVPK